jgi:hypothetical protein
MLIDITNIDKAKALLALYENSYSKGTFGQLNSFFAPDMTIGYARKIVNGGIEIPQKQKWWQRMLFINPKPIYSDPQLRFGYVYGHPIKIDLSKKIIDPLDFDRDNGQGACWRALAPLGATLVED